MSDSPMRPQTIDHRPVSIGCVQTQISSLAIFPVGQDGLSFAVSPRLVGHLHKKLTNRAGVFPAKIADHTDIIGNDVDQLTIMRFSPDSSSDEAFRDQRNCCATGGLMRSDCAKLTLTEGNRC